MPQLSEEIQRRLRCPVTNEPLLVNGQTLQVAAEPSINYPIVDDVPVVLNEANSLFSIEDFVRNKKTTLEFPQADTFKQRILRRIPDISLNVKASRNYQRFASLMPEQAKILVVGGSIAGQGMEALYSDPSFEMIGSDVTFGPHTKLIADAHDLPFQDETFDGVVIQAVLEHVLDPRRCVEEIYRVLKPSAIVYGETPFIQQVHMQQYDFTRFTHLGHRRLFNQFDEIESGTCCGPGMALAWSYTYFLTSFARSRRLRSLAYWFARCTSFYLKYFDYFLVDKPGGSDAASGVYFLGRKSPHALSDRQLIDQFQGYRY